VRETKSQEVCLFLVVGCYTRMHLAVVVALLVSWHHNDQTTTKTDIMSGRDNVSHDPHSIRVSDAHSPKCPSDDQNLGHLQNALLCVVRRLSKKLFISSLMGTQKQYGTVTTTPFASRGMHSMKVQLQL